MRKIRSKTKKKILLILEAGIALGLSSHNFRQQRFILKQIPKELSSINKYELIKNIKDFYNKNLINYQEKTDGNIEVILTEKGREHALLYSLDTIQIKKPNTWNSCWHLVLFDIPEKKRKGRDALREKLKELGFYEWQKSAFIYPYPCSKEVEFIVEIFDLRPYVRYAELRHPTNESELKLKFKLY